MHEAKDIESVHIQFLRRLLVVKKSTNLTAIYGELGRYPLKVIRQLKHIKYWTKIVKQNEISLIKSTYLFLKKEGTDCGRHYNGKKMVFSQDVMKIYPENNISASHVI